ncbi:hypothetical protein CPB86DRAFT_563917 [Serendipita vermifera]|nr:hypothetical protein CPB86DRAFT_563917 [Serendipita vermifera]
MDSRSTGRHESLVKLDRKFIGTENSISRVAPLVNAWRIDIERLGRTDMQQRSSILQHHDQVAEILTRGCTVFNDMKTSPTPSAKLSRVIEEAIQKDRLDLEESLGNRITQTDTRPLRIEVSFMNSNQPPVTIEDQFFKYHEIRLALLRAGHIAVRRGHIWVRCTTSQHSLTTNGYCWEYASADSNIKAELETLHVQFVDVTNRNEYIVAILHNAMGREFPEALGELRHGVEQPSY